MRGQCVGTQPYQPYQPYQAYQPYQLYPALPALPSLTQPYPALPALARVVSGCREGVKIASFMAQMAKMVGICYGIWPGYVGICWDMLGYVEGYVGICWDRLERAKLLSFIP